VKAFDTSGHAFKPTQQALKPPIRLSFAKVCAGPSFKKATVDWAQISLSTMDATEQGKDRCPKMDPACH